MRQNAAYQNTVQSQTWTGTAAPDDSTGLAAILFGTPFPSFNIVMDEQRLHIMDWKPRTNQAVPSPAGEPDLRTAAGWTFGADDLVGICVNCPEHK